MNEGKSNELLLKYYGWHRLFHIARKGIEWVDAKKTVQTK